MCGIAGLWHLDSSQRVDPAQLQRMTAIQRHRGPDDEGYVLIDTRAGMAQLYGGAESVQALGLPRLAQASAQGVGDLAFGFRRLAILDLSPAGHQPMATADGRCWIVYNGEIYNYVELRAELVNKGYTFRTATDTEVILYAYTEWGEECLNHFNGMWAFALWDQRQQRLFCARDRFGIKPFYYYWDGRTFAFASEIKALLTLPAVERRPNDAIIYDYLRYGRTDFSAETFFADVAQLLPAHSFCLKADGQFQTTRYWALPPAAPDNVLDNFSGSEADYTQKFYALFEDAVRLRLRSDVSVGTCLSGGLDSSSIVCVANQLLLGEHGAAQAMGERQKTFSSCYADPRFDERTFIEMVLAQTGAEQNYTFPSADTLMAVADKLVWHQDEPFGGMSIFAQWSVMELAAQRGVTVMLDGQGSDELLAGYHPCFDYFWGGLLRQGQWRSLGVELQHYHQRYHTPWPRLLPRPLRPFAPTNIQGAMRRFQRGGALGIASDFDRAYQHRSYEFVYQSADPLYHYLADLLQYSIPMLLRFEDRNAMAHSIEARVPFLDYRLVEFAFSLPPTMKIKAGVTKHILRSAMHGVLPEAVRTRKDKMGFVAPERIWLADDLYPWIQTIVTSESFRSRGYFDQQQIVAALHDHKAGKRDLSKLAWRWINLELWLQQMVDNPHATP